MRSKWSHLRQLWSETRWILLGSIWLAGLILGYLGFARFSGENSLFWSAGDLFYRTLQLIVLESGSVTGRVNWMLETARFLLPALTVYTVLQALMHLFREQTQWLRLWGLRDHVVVCGLGRKGIHLVRELLALGQRVVVIEQDPDREKMADIHRQGGILLTGDATNRDCLASTRLHRAHHLICLLGQDSQNLEVALQAYQLTRGRRRGTLTCVAHLGSPDLLDLIKSSELSMGADVPFQFETFHPYARAARLLLQEDPCLQDTARLADVPGHLLVIGLGRLGENLVVQAAYTWRRLQQQARLHITVLDRDAEEKTTILLQKYPQLSKVCRLFPKQVDLSSAGLLHSTLKDVGGPAEIQRVYICLSDPILSLQVCLSLTHTPGFQSIPILVRLANETGLSDLLKKPVPGLFATGQVQPFDLFQRTCSADLVVAGPHELLARDLHELYRNGIDAASNRQPSGLPWDQLPNGLKEANRQQAKRIHRLLDSTGYRINTLQDWDGCGYVFKADEVEQMACMEHELWRQARQADGWRWGIEKDAKQRTHPNLVAWGDLPESEREKNRTMVRHLPVLLARIGYQIDKLSA